MLLSGPLLSLFLVASARAADIPTALDCVDPATKDAAACDRRIEDVVAIVPGASYVAKIECNDCPYSRETELAHAGHEVLTSDQILVCW